MKCLFIDFSCSFGHTGYLPVEVKKGRLEKFFCNSKLRCRLQMGHLSLSCAAVVGVGLGERSQLTYSQCLGGLKVGGDAEFQMAPSCVGTVEVIRELSCLSR
jgi:hypothetical protein